jgi:hypothetical protein
MVQTGDNSVHHRLVTAEHSDRRESWQTKTSSPLKTKSKNWRSQMPKRSNKGFTGFRLKPEIPPEIPPPHQTHAVFQPLPDIDKGNVTPCQHCKAEFRTLFAPQRLREQAAEVIGLPIILCGICLSDAKAGKIKRTELEKDLRRDAKL